MDILKMPLMLPSSKKLLSLNLICSFLFNPLLLASIYGKSASALTNMAIVASIYHAIEGDALLTIMWHAISVGLNLHPILLAAPLLVATYRGPTSLFKQVGVFATVLSLYLLASYYYANGWEFIGSTFGCRLFYKLLTPNIGLYWYLFSQVFEFFRPLFTNFLQALSLVYGIPIAIRFKKDPLFMLTITLAIHTLLQPYPTVAELGLVISLYLLLHELGPCNFPYRFACSCFRSSIYNHRHISRSLCWRITSCLVVLLGGDGVGQCQLLLRSHGPD